MKAFFYSLCLLTLPVLSHAQTGGAKPAPATPALITTTDNAPKTDAPAITFNVEANRASKVMRVRTNAKGPMQLEVNDSDGRPVLSKQLMANGAAMSVPIGNLPDGSYVVRCSVADKTFMRRMVLGQ